jgi:hypothetical protein
LKINLNFNADFKPHPMKKHYLLILSFFLFASFVSAQSLVNCDFTVASKACIGQEVKVTYVGGTSGNATYLWNFDGGTVISGTGQGPYFVKWATAGEKHIVLSMQFEGQSCTATRPVVVIEQPAMFHMTGGGILFPGSSGVAVGLSGSETGVIYKLRLNGQYTAISVTGTGQHISFGAQTVPGNYTAVAKVDGSDCMREMDGMAVITSGGTPATPFICMVTFDTATGKNKIIWNKHPGLHLSHFNIYRETYQNNVFDKIGEVPYAVLSVFVDPTSDPLIKSDRFKISATDSAGLESEKSPYHKTIHLNINPGIFGFNLIWNHYEGFDFLTYRIHRKHSSGPWEVIDSVAANVDSYTDFYTESGVTTYYIEVLRPEPCSPSLKTNELLSVISNIAASAPLGLGETDNNGVSVYPNPANDLLNVVLSGQEAVRYEILRLDGVVAISGQTHRSKTVIRVAELTDGLYLLRITGANSVSVRKFVKN